MNNSGKLKKNVMPFLRNNYTIEKTRCKIHLKYLIIDRLKYK